MSQYQVYKKEGLWVIKDPEGYIISGALSFEKKQAAITAARVEQLWNPGSTLAIYNTKGDLIRVEKPRS